jgi:acyl-CoA hydrolase
MEVFIDCFIEDQISGERRKSNEAIYTFVAVNEVGRPTRVPPVVPETELEKRRYEGALLRRQLALVLSNKLEPGKATELRKFCTS